MNESDKLKAKIQERLGIKTHLDIAKDSPEYASILKGLGISTLIPNPDTLKVLEDAPEHTPSASKSVKVLTASSNAPSRLLSVLIQ